MNFLCKQTQLQNARRNFCLRFHFFLALVLLASIVSSPADTVTLTTVADSEIDQASPNSNFGSLPSMVSGALGSIAHGVIRRGVLRFDLTGQIPSGSIINSVSVSLTVVKIPLTPANSNFDLRRLLQNWNETQVTWNSRLSGTFWGLPGAIGPTDSVATASSSVFVTGLSTYTFPSTSSLVADVQAWVNDPTSNNGWLLISEAEGTLFTARHFGTHEDPANAPTMVVDFTAPGPVIQTQPQSQTVTVGNTASFNVTASGAQPLTYQWEFEGNVIPDETNDVLVLSNVQTNESGDYVVIVTDGNGLSTTSQTATLTVLPPAPGLPNVTITNPPPGSKFPLGAPVFIGADASESNGSIAQVEFFLNSDSVGVVFAPPFELALSNLSAGSYVLNATATDLLGSNATSPVIQFSVVAPPLVAIIQPANGSAFLLGSNVNLSASASSSGATVTNVEFFSGNTLIGQSPGPLFRLSWKPPQSGSFVLSAIAFDNLAQSGTSPQVTISVFIPEFVAPTIAITSSPPNFTRTTSPLVSLAGKAADDIGVDHVEYQINGGPFQKAEGSTEWTAHVALVPGPDTVRIRSVDLAGNVSLPATRFFTYVVFSTLSVQENGQGSVAPDLNGMTFEIGKVLTVTAHPATGQLFAGWGGISNPQGKVLSFAMASNLVLVANFVTNLFPPVAGTYSGLFFNQDTNAISPDSSGAISLQSDKQGSFSGKILMNGSSASFHGQFNPEGAVTLPVIRHEAAPVVLALQMDLTNGSGELTGFATNAEGTNVLVSLVNAKKQATKGAPLVGSYSFMLEGPSNQVFATVFAQIGPKGAVTFQGALSGGHSFKSTAILAFDGSAPFYVNLDHGSAILIGFVQFSNQPPGSVAGSAFWSQPPLVVPLEAVEIPN